MLLSVVLTFIVESERPMPASHGRAIYAFFLDLLESRFPLVAKALHAPTKEKPFTTSPIQGKFKSYKGNLYPQRGSLYWFRFTSLTKDLSVMLKGQLFSIRGKKIEILNNDFVLSEVITSQEKHPFAAEISYVDFFKKWTESSKNMKNKVIVRFFSPTAFRDGKRNVPLPIPQLFLQSVFRKWNAFSPFLFKPICLEILLKRIVLSRCEIKTKILSFDKQSEVGFVGDCEFMLIPFQGNIYDSLFHLLSDYAFYCGVGATTSMGMGQVKVL